MGVPKFFRYISERYPCLSELVKEYQIPDFDNLYLDMNGIIHTCSHPDDYDPHFRISEEQIFKDIFHYIEVLFRMIKPQKLFFMAVDGVAPRAKMNQQRGRRFRSARESQKLEAKAKQRGEALPEAARFDSNCITPGTEFMAKLQQQLKYFVVTKITTDKLWRNCQIVLSGPETPGEGEHKIMDYIRYMRAQPGYDPNTRHCLYGLDADLIMLGLCTHEPHFSLLREEVQFGKKNNKRKTIPEQITFYLLHLSLMREYLELEFQSVKDRLSFKYDIESIIDDWVLMGFLVGNDFIPHLPNLHIANGALPMLYNAYMKVLPDLDGYINEEGLLNLERFEKFMEALRNIDMDHFSEHYADLKYFEEKTGRKWGQKGKKLEAWQCEVPEAELISLEPEPPRKPMSSELEALINKTNEMFLEPSEENLKDLATNEDVDDDDREINYLESDCDSTDGTEDGLLDAEFQQHKKDYYMNKLDYAQVTPEVLRAQAEGYVTAIQWNLHYYYNGVCSWSWYYPHHYAPFISDIKDFKDYKFHFELGEPFKPYEQLLAVLPSASKSLLPECYWDLMTEDSSLIKGYYPVEFNTDLNGKKQDWEAVVLIPFIDEKNLLEAMEPCNNLLTAEEVKRNTHGPMLIYSYTDANGGNYEAPEYFPMVPNHHAQWRLVSRDEIRVDISDLVKGAYPGAKMDVYFPGFPTMKHLKYSSRLEKAKVKVFDQPSRNESMILTIQSSASEVIESIATNLLGKDVYVGWPHLVEAIVVAVSNRNFKYKKAGNDGEYNVEENKGNAFDLEKHAIAEYYKDRMGVDVGAIEILVHIKIMTGRKYSFTPQGRVNLEKQWADVPSAYPIQTVVTNIEVYSEKYKMYKNIEEVFPIGSTCYMIGHPHYGCLATVLDSKESLKKGRVKVRIKYKAADPDFDKVREMEDVIRVNYMPLHMAAGRLKISRHVLSRVTGCLLVTLGLKEDRHNCQEASRVNLGLDLKYNKKNEEIPGYTRKDGREWLYSQKTVELVKEYMTTYPRLFEYLSYNSNEDVFYESELFPEDQGSGETIKEIQKWLKKRPTASIERQACGTLVLEPDVVQLIETITSDYDAEEEKESVVMQVKPHLLFRPDIQIGHMAPDATATYRLYDRVVNIRESYTVPLGYTGTVIAIHQPASGKLEDTMYDVLFDKPFAGGIALNCSPNRGYRMSNFSLINKSHGKRKVENKLGTPGLLRQQLSGMSQPTMKQIIQQSQQQQQQSNGNQQGSAFASWNNGPPPPHNRNEPPNFYMPQQNYNYQPPKSFNNYAFPQSAPVNMPSKRFDFMPNFGPKIPPNSGDQFNNFGKPASYKNEDADALKKLLKIGEPGDVGSSNSPRIRPAPPASGASKESNSVTVQDLFAHAKANPLKQDKPPSIQPQQKSCSLELLQYFQLEGLGCPHYRYFNLPGQSQYQAELMIPSSGEMLLGDPAGSKEEACENVARVMLHTLKNKQSTTVSSGMPVNFPNPPKQWWEPGNSQQETKRWPGTENVRPNQSSYQRDGQDRRKEYSLLEREKPAKPLRQKQAEAVPFVPLQAVKQQRVSKPGSSNPTNVVNKSRNGSGSEATKQPKHGSSPKTNASTTEPTENANAPKPRRKREMRLAANFHFNPKIA